jgi:SNF2 family DNA or RNA helicase
MKKYKFDFSPKTRPFPHQVEAINYVTTHNSVALFDEQGLGKTKIVIEALCNNMNSGKINGALIICKKSLLLNWKDEIEFHTHLKSIILRGTANEIGEKFMGFSYFYLINYNAVIAEKERLKEFLNLRKFAIVLDESHTIKNPYSKTSEAIFSIKDFALKKIIISGTPVANKPIDLWSQYYFLDNGILLGKDFNVFQKNFSINLRHETKYEQEEKFSGLREIIFSNSIRRLKVDVLELPQKIFVDNYVFLKGRQREIYDQVRDELFVEITNNDGKKVIDEAEEIFKKLLRLEQIASNPFLFDKSYSEVPEKFVMLDRIIEEIISRPEKVIIWSCFVENISILSHRFKSYGSLTLHGGIPIEERNQVVEKFKDQDKYKILVANPAAAKEGLTLTSANNAIYVDRNFNLVDYLQSQDRIHRITQNKECRIYKIIAKNTIDEYIDVIINKKNSLAKYIQGDSQIVKDNPFLSREEILQMLGGK